MGGSDTVENELRHAEPARKDVAVRECLYARCVQREVDEEGEVVDVRRFPLLTLRHSQLGLYGCPVAIELLLSFQLECAFVLGLMFLLALPALQDNWARSARRDECRAAHVLNATAPAVASCDYAGRPVRLPLPMQPSYLSASLGACEEFSNATAQLQPAIDLPSPYTSTPGASFCLDGGGGGGGGGGSQQEWAQWGFCGAFVLLLAFLLRLRRLQAVKTRNFDARVWTVADYSVMISHLEKGVDPAALEHTLRQVSLPADQGGAAQGAPEERSPSSAHSGIRGLMDCSPGRPGCASPAWGGGGGGEGYRVSLPHDRPPT